MPSVIQRSFAGGELAPALYARADQIKYATGLRTCRNFQVMRHGGATNRPGTGYIATTKTLGRRVRLLKFVFNADQTYVLEFGHLYMRVYRLGGQVAVSGVTAWSAATNYVVGDLAAQAGVNYYCILAHINQVPPNATYWYALTGTIYEIPTPYDEAHLQDLQTVQSGDVVTITHPSYEPRELRRAGHTTWTLVTISFAPSIAAPTGLVLTPAGAGTGTYEYVVTAIKAETYEESVASSAANDATCSTPTEQVPNALAWNAVSGAQQYYVYKSNVVGGTPGFIGVSNTNAFNDININPDYTRTPPVARTPLAGADNYPGTVTYTQQRRGFANSNNSPETTWLTRSADQDNLTISYPSQEDDAVTFTLRGREVNAIRHLLEVDARFIVMTAGGVWEIQGDASGVITPFAINPRQIDYNGASTLRPVIVSNTALYVQARGSVVRDLRYEVASDGSGSSGYRGRDLSVYADHLFKGYTITDWDYQQIPESIVWAVRSDGVLLGLTYLREHEIWGWHRHDTGLAEGDVVENVACVPEGDEDALYLVVRRTIGGIAYRYIERLHTRRVTDITVDAFFVDSGLTYDGRNTGATTMTLTTGGGWTVQDLLTVESSVAYFVAGDVGNEMRLRSGDTEIRLAIVGYTDNQHVTGYPSQDVPAALQAVATTDWGKAVDELSGFGHLEGRTVSVLGDGAVDPQKTVTAGAITLSRPYEVIHVGLPIQADLETLDLEVVNGQTLLDKKKRLNNLTVITQDSRGFKAGDDADHLKERTVEVSQYPDPNAADSDKTEIIPSASWNNHGRVFLRQDDPLPLTVLAVIPSGFVGG